MPSEKEIENLIANNVLCLLKWHSDPETELGLEPEEWPWAEVVGVKEAAHAIHERLAEEVVWEGEWELPMPWLESDEFIIKVDDGYEGGEAHILGLSAGQRVRVYVVKEDEDGS